ncbi:ribosome small subunit-dependent GTPase A [Jannaschia seohaensis]|uniref:Small ribosomal subunit biogenesis GTPase RsgA n=1 Tax=Jannaschia seohaensis TaxID=475081 RepID=A0A2Y9B1J5_9RHOB|nr:ribosome small subunit-dependent GTPase A [Jannaschia seohaensis]PWJ15056.1 ribosome biogenesis GTPase [Jannaschia seohaensis]SSA49905.1 ribosome biogenesis GTPase [Jannaschia seohaensis]
MTTPPPALTLAQLGWHPFFAAQIDADALTETPPVRVMRVHRSGLDVQGEGRAETLPPDAEVTVGDWLLLGGDGRPLERRSLIRRRAPGRDREVQLVAANVDTVFVTTSCNADFNVARLERYLALAFEAGCDPVIVLTKADLSDEVDDYVARAAALSPLVPVLAVNAKAAAAREALMPWCGPGRTVAFLGTSGVGKSTLLNALAGVETAATGAIREDDARGRHTTTRRELHVVPGGFCVIDTPGMRELQLTDAAGGIGEVFADIAELAGGCRFSDCAHLSEPGCAVRAAVAAGDLDPDRLERWRKLAAEDAHNTADIAERRRRDKAFGKKVRAATRAKRR